VNSETLVVIYAKILLSETFAIHCKNNYSSDKIKEFSQTTQLLIQNAKECIQSLPDGHLQVSFLYNSEWMNSISELLPTSRTLV
jgi:hypothetical protein